MVLFGVLFYLSLLARIFGGVKEFTDIKDKFTSFWQFFSFFMPFKSNMFAAFICLCIYCQIEIEYFREKVFFPVASK